jgi:hypothetical protein
VIKDSFENITSIVLKDFVCYQVWIRKGKVEGVHPDFGKLSYIRSEKISDHYHCTDDDRVEILLELSDRLGKL